MPQGAVPFPFGKCRICNDKATGVHYGVATCEGCKGFYKRSIPKGDKYRCYFGSCCVISPENRNRCKACRFKKCLQQGMAVEAVKMGRIPKVEREKALEQAATMRTDADEGSHSFQFATTSISTANMVHPNIHALSSVGVGSEVGQASQNLSLDEDKDTNAWNTPQSSNMYEDSSIFQQFATGDAKGSAVKLETLNTPFLQNTFSSTVGHSQTMMMEHSMGPVDSQPPMSCDTPTSKTCLTVVHSTGDQSMPFPNSHLNQSLDSNFQTQHCLDRMRGIQRGHSFPGSSSDNSQNTSPGDDTNSSNVGSDQSTASMYTFSDSVLNGQNAMNIALPQEENVDQFDVKEPNVANQKNGSVGDGSIGWESRGCLSEDISVEPLQGQSSYSKAGSVAGPSVLSAVNGDRGSKTVGASGDGDGSDRGRQAPFSTGVIKMLFQQVMENRNMEQCDKLLKKLARSYPTESCDSGLDLVHSIVPSSSSSFTSAVATMAAPLLEMKAALDAKPNLHTSLSLSSSAAITPALTSTVISHCPNTLPSQPGYPTSHCDSVSVSSGMNSSKESAVVPAEKGFTASQFHATPNSASMDMFSGSQTVSTSGTGDCFTEKGGTSQMPALHHSSDSETLSKYSGLLSTTSGQPKFLPQPLPTCLPASVSHSETLSSSQAHTRLIGWSEHFSGTDSVTFTVSPSFSHTDDSATFTDKFFTTPTFFSDAEISSNCGQAHIMNRGDNIQMHIKHPLPNSYPPSHTLTSEQLQCHTHQVQGSSNLHTNPLPSSSVQAQSFPPMDNLGIIQSAAESNSCSLDFNYLCHEQVRDQHELSVTSDTNSPVLNSDSFKMTFNPALLPDPQMKEAVMILDNNTYAIFELGVRRMLRDKFLKIKLKDKMVDVPPTVPTHMDMYPMLIDSMPIVNQKIIKFCQVAPGFAKLDLADQKILLKRAYYDIWMLTSSEFFVDGESYLMVTEDVFYVRRHMEKIIGVAHTETFHMFAQQFNALGLSHLEVAIMCCIQLTAPSHDQQTVLKDVKQIQKLNSFYLDLLVAVVTLIHPDTCSRVLVDIFRLVPLLAEVNRLQRELIAAFSITKPPETPASDVPGDLQKAV